MVALAITDVNSIFSIIQEEVLAASAEADWFAFRKNSSNAFLVLWQSAKALSAIFRNS
jgi:hypothetical protein